MNAQVGCDKSLIRGSSIGDLFFFDDLLGDTDSIVRYWFAPLGSRRSSCLLGPGGTVLSSLRLQLAIGGDFSGISRDI